MAAGTKANFPLSPAISNAGISNDQTDAAIITPDAKPNSNFSIFLLISPFIKNTVAAPSVVPKKGIINPVTMFILSSPLKLGIA